MPRVNGNCPGRPIEASAFAGRSCSVYRGWIGSPESVVNDASRSGVRPYASRHSDSDVGTPVG